MSSILKVDQIQTTAGAAPTAKDLGFAADGVVQTKLWYVTPVVVSTSGSWAASTAPTTANTYSVGSYSFTKKHSDSKVFAILSGHVDHSGTSSHPTIVALFEAGGTRLGAAYRHVRVQNNEPLSYCFSGEDTTTGTSKTYQVRCHSSGTSMSFGRSNANNSAHVFTVVFMEIAQ
tara:strand:- start:14124 stop:14645 length:522 start_codon:yes stop_codon:yes gene_type:complete